MQITEIVTLLGGFATRSQLLAAGSTPREIAAAVAARQLVRVRRAWYAVPSSPWEQRIAVALGGRVGAFSAARSYGWWTGLDRDIHVSWSAHGNVAVAGRRLGYPHAKELAERRIVPHWRVSRDDAHRTDLWRENPVETIAQVFKYAGPEEGVPVADSALRCGDVTREELLALAPRLPMSAAAALRFIDPEPDSGLESIVRFWLIQCGIPFVHHASIAGLEVDFLVGDSLVLELDGGTHKTAEGFERDRQRDALLVSLGYVVLRFTYDRVMHHREEWQAAIRRNLANGNAFRTIQPLGTVRR